MMRTCRLLGMRVLLARHPLSSQRRLSLFVINLLVFALRENQVYMWETVPANQNHTLERFEIKNKLC